jgi:FKBP-type peptidyl-prolyl cis-trans isomerase FkpA
MKLKFPLIAAFAAILSLTACGGGGSDSAGGAVSVSSPAALTKTDTVVGSGAEATSGNKVQVNYTGWLYNAAAADFKGTRFDASQAGKPLAFTIGAVGTGDSVIPGFSQGVLGMKVGGKRTILIPSNLGYGTSGSGPIPANSGLVFEVELVAICATSTC